MVNIWSSGHAYEWKTGENKNELGGSVSAMDLKNKVFSIKYGLYTDEWVTVNWLGTPEFREKPWWAVNY